MTAQVPDGRAALWEEPAGHALPGCSLILDDPLGSALLREAGERGELDANHEARSRPRARDRSAHRAHAARGQACSSVTPRTYPVPHLSMGAAAIESVALRPLPSRLEHVRHARSLPRLRFSVAGDAVPSVRAVVSARALVRARSRGRAVGPPGHGHPRSARGAEASGGAEARSRHRHSRDGA